MAICAGELRHNLWVNFNERRSGCCFREWSNFCYLVSILVVLLSNPILCDCWLILVQYAILFFLEQIKAVSGGINYFIDLCYPLSCSMVWVRSSIENLSIIFMAGFWYTQYSTQQMARTFHITSSSQYYIWQLVCEMLLMIPL